MNEGLTQRIVDFICDMRFEDIPGAAVDIVRTGFTDCVAVMIAGASEPVTGIVGSVVPRQGGNGEARLYLSPERAAAPDAALISGTAAHALDYDDVAMDAHPSSPLVATLLSEGEALGSSGRELVTAYVAGYEVWADLAFRDSSPHHAKGWHPTAIFGVIAAAAAASVLHRLSPARVHAALGIAASHAGGLTANFRHHDQAVPCRPSRQQRHHGGASGQSRHDRRGRRVRASLGVSHRDLAGQQGRSRSPLFPSRPGVARLRYGLNVKKYPMCYAVHRTLDGFLDLVAKRPVAVGEIAEVGNAARRNPGRDPAQPPPADRPRG